MCLVHSREVLHDTLACLWVRRFVLFNSSSSRLLSGLQTDEPRTAELGKHVFFLYAREVEQVFDS